jgi:hypothetical protein
MMLSGIKPAGHVVVAGGGPGFAGTRSFTIDGRSAYIEAGPGADAMSAQEQGQPGHSVFIGDVVALAAAAQVTGQAAFAFDDVTILMVSGVGYAGLGGFGGGVNVKGGNAAPGGLGGVFEITVGRHGSWGQGTKVSIPAFASPLVQIVDALNGGNSNSSLTLGGRGGRLRILRPPPTPDVTEFLNTSSRTDNVANGGVGFQGCAAMPITNGTDGGGGGSLSDATSLLPAPTMSFNGGAGGHGNPPGNGGAAGTNEDSGATIGTAGANGSPCPQLVDAVVLSSTLGSYPAGSITTLDRVTGGHLGNPESGCSSVHLHGTIFIDGTGPYADPQPSGCGQGPIVQVPKSAPFPSSR